MTSSHDTIFALSSGSLPSGVAVVRVSGPAVAIVMQHFQLGTLEPRTPRLKPVRRPNGDLLDRGLLLSFVAPHSFTGEDILELHLHGGRAVVQAVLDELASVPSCRHAEPGEFTRRAFENNRLDLTEAEGLADLIAADTEMQRRLAMSQARGDQARLYRDWMDRLSRARALIEAELDFPEEDDIPGAISDRVWTDVKQIGSEINSFLAKARFGEIVRDGFSVAIIGRPNAGKSSLLNLISKRPAAIVTDIPGTTRDLITVDLDLQGYLIRLTDTAGLRDTHELVEAEGIKRARTAAANADLILSLRELGDKTPFEHIDSEVEHLFVTTKCDMGSTDDDGSLSISTQSNIGIEELTGAIVSRIEQRAATGALDLAPARARHQSLLTSAVEHIDFAQTSITEPLEVRSEALRLAARDLGKITGFVNPDDLLSLIFSEFCIGK